MSKSCSQYAANQEPSLHALCTQLYQGLSIHLKTEESELLFGDPQLFRDLTVVLGLLFDHHAATDSTIHEDSRPSLPALFSPEWRSCVTSIISSALTQAWKLELQRLHQGAAQLHTFMQQHAQELEQFKESCRPEQSQCNTEQQHGSKPEREHVHQQHMHRQEQQQQGLTLQQDQCGQHGLSPLHDVLGNPCMVALMATIKWHTTPDGQRSALHALDLERCGHALGQQLHVSSEAYKKLREAEEIRRAPWSAAHVETARFHFYQMQQQSVDAKDGEERVLGASLPQLHDVGEGKGGDAAAAFVSTQVQSLSDLDVWEQEHVRRVEALQWQFSGPEGTLLVVDRWGSGHTTQLDDALSMAAVRRNQHDVPQLRGFLPRRTPPCSRVMVLLLGPCFDPEMCEGLERTRGHATSCAGTGTGKAGRGSFHAEQREQGQQQGIWEEARDKCRRLATLAGRRGPHVLQATAAVQCSARPKAHSSAREVQEGARQELVLVGLARSLARHATKDPACPGLPNRSACISTRADVVLCGTTLPELLRSDRPPCADDAGMVALLTNGPGAVLGVEGLNLLDWRCARQTFGGHRTAHTAVAAALLEQLANDEHRGLMCRGPAGSGPYLDLLERYSRQLAVLASTLEQAAPRIRPGAVCLSYEQSCSWVQNCRVVSHCRRALVCEKGATLLASNVCIERPFTGLYLQTQSSLKASHIHISHARSHGVEMYEGSSARLANSSITDCTGSAIFAFECELVLAGRCLFSSCEGLSMQEQSRRAMEVEERRSGPCSSGQAAARVHGEDRQPPGPQQHQRQQQQHRSHRRCQTLSAVDPALLKQDPSVSPSILGLTPNQGMGSLHLTDQERTHALVYPEGTLASAILCDKTKAVHMIGCEFNCCTQSLFLSRNNHLPVVPDAAPLQPRNLIQKCTFSQITCPAIFVYKVVSTVIDSCTADVPMTQFLRCCLATDRVELRHFSVPKGFGTTISRLQANGSTLGTASTAAPSTVAARDAHSSSGSGSRSRNRSSTDAPCGLDINITDDVVFSMLLLCPSPFNVSIRSTEGRLCPAYPALRMMMMVSLEYRPPLVHDHKREARRRWLHYVRSLPSGKRALDLLGGLRHRTWCEATLPGKEGAFVGRIVMHPVLGPIQQAHVSVHDARTDVQCFLLDEIANMTDLPEVCPCCSFALNTPWREQRKQQVEQVARALSTGGGPQGHIRVERQPPHAPDHCMLHQRAMAGLLLPLEWLEPIFQLHMQARCTHAQPCSAYTQQGQSEPEHSTLEDNAGNAGVTSWGPLTVHAFPNIDEAPSGLQDYFKQSMAQVDSDEEDAGTIVDQTLFRFQEASGFSLSDELSFVCNWAQTQSSRQEEDKNHAKSRAKEIAEKKKQVLLAKRACGAVTAEKLMDAWGDMLAEFKDAGLLRMWRSVTAKNQAHLDALLWAASARHAREIACRCTEQHAREFVCKSTKAPVLSSFECMGLDTMSIWQSPSLLPEVEQLSVAETAGRKGFHLMCLGELSKDERELWQEAKTRQSSLRNLEEAQEAQSKPVQGGKPRSKAEEGTLKLLNDHRRRLAEERCKLLNDASEGQKRLHLHLYKRCSQRDLGSAQPARNDKAG